MRKTLILALCLLPLGGALFVQEASAATYAGQSCQSRTDGASLAYRTHGAVNGGSGIILITCPATRALDFVGGEGDIDGTIYFVNDGRSKTCVFENFDIDTGGFGLWHSVTGVRRLAFPSLYPGRRWSPLTFNCTLPAGSTVIGYTVVEHGASQ